MGLFCLFWIPLAYFFRRTVAVGSAGGSAWALVFGSVLVAVQFFVGPLVDPGYFGFYRWLSSFVDVVSAPVLVPLVLYLLFVEMGLVSAKTDYASFALLWLVPLSAFRAAQWLSPPSPVMLVIVPMLWASLALGIPAMVGVAKKHRCWYVIAPAAMCIAALPFAAATSWWAFFSHRTAIGFLFLAISVFPSLVSSAIPLFLMVMGRRPEAAESVLPEEDLEDGEFEDDAGEGAEPEMRAEEPGYEFGEDEEFGEEGWEAETETHAEERGGEFEEDWETDREKP